MTDLPPSPATTPKPGRWLRLALVVSLAFNLLGLGVVAGGAWRLARLDPAQAGPDIRALWRAMPDDLRASLRQTARTQGFMDDDREPRRERAARLNTALIAALQAEPFDAQGFAALLGGDRDAQASRLQSAHAALAEQIARLDPAARAAMAERFARALHERPRR